MTNLITTDSNNIEENNCLIFSLKEKLYGINVENILEIIKVPKLDVPQKMPKHILGVITYNNISIKVVDLSTILAHKTQKYSLDANIILVKTEESIFGIIADSVNDVKPLKSSNIQPLPYHSEENLIQYIYRLDNNFISIIDLNSVQNVIQKTQFEISDIDVTELLPQDEPSKKEMENRQYELIKKFETSIEQIYYDQEQYIIFALGKNLYSLPIKQIKEIVNFKNIFIINLPRMYNYIEGIFSLRGDFISVLNFKKFLNIEEERDSQESSMLIVLELKDFKLALMVDKIIDIVTVTSNEIINKFDNKFESKYIISELHVNNQIISIISLEKLLTDERLYIKD